MPSRTVLTLAAALLSASCNTPSPTPEVATPENGVVDTVAAAGAPIADSANAVVDSTLGVPDSTAVTVDSTTVADSVN